MAPDTFFLAAVQAIEASRGRQRGDRAAGGLLLGALGGGVIGLLRGTIAARGLDPSDEGAITKGLGAIVCVAVGAVVGTAIGAATAKERWEPVWRR